MMDNMTIAGKFMLETTLIGGLAMLFTAIFIFILVCCAGIYDEIGPQEQKPK